VSNHCDPLVGEEGAVEDTAIPARESTYAFVARCVLSVGVAAVKVPPKLPDPVTCSPFLTLKSLLTVAIYYSLF
jgi:hypothetical protein